MKQNFRRSYLRIRSLQDSVSARCRNFFRRAYPVQIFRIPNGGAYVRQKRRAARTAKKANNKKRSESVEIQTVLFNGSGSYLSSRAVARKVLSAQVSLTSVFGMRTGGSSPPSPPLWYISRSRFACPSLHVLPAFPDKYLFLSALQADNRIVNYFFRLFSFSVLFQASACFLHNLFQYQFVSLSIA